MADDSGVRTLISDLTSAIDEGASTLSGIAAMISFLTESTVTQPKLNDALCTIERIAKDAAAKLDATQSIGDDAASAKPSSADPLTTSDEFGAALAKVQSLNRELDLVSGDNQPEVDRFADERSDAIKALVCPSARDIAHVRAKLLWMWQDGGSYKVEDDLYRPQIMADLARLEHAALQPAGTIGGQQ